MKVKTSELIGAALDWTVAIADDEAREGLTVEQFLEGRDSADWLYSYSEDWAQAGPLIERHGIRLFPDDPVMPKATITPNVNEQHYYFREYGETTLVAAMRVLVASTLGEEVEVPDALVDEVNAPSNNGRKLKV